LSAFGLAAVVLDQVSTSPMRFTSDSSRRAKSLLQAFHKYLSVRVRLQNRKLCLKSRDLHARYAALFEQTPSRARCAHAGTQVLACALSVSTFHQRAPPTRSSPDAAKLRALVAKRCVSLVPSTYGAMS
jgi:hypothetical protein